MFNAQHQPLSLNSQSILNSPSPATPVNKRKSLGASPRPILADSNRKRFDQGANTATTTPQSSLARSIHQASPVPNRLLVGASPNGLRAQSENSPRAKFVTPFKNGKRPLPRKPLTERPINYEQPQAMVMQKKSDSNKLISVFDLSCPYLLS